MMSDTFFALIWQSGHTVSHLLSAHIFLPPLTLAEGETICSVRCTEGNEEKFRRWVALVLCCDYYRQQTPL